MEKVYTTHCLCAGNRELTIRKGENSVDIRITKRYSKDPYNEEIAEEEVNIPISLETYEKLVHEMWTAC